MNLYLEKHFSLEGKLAIVTGAARGNGFAISKALGLAGADVIMVDILDEVKSSSEELISMGISARHFVCDITSDDDLTRLRIFCGEISPKMDILVNNAGVTYPHESLTYPDELWDITYKVNLLAPFKLCRTFGPMMIESGRASIINITSLNAEMAFPDNPAYVAFKGGMKQLTKSLALDFGRYGIRANNIGPGYFATSMTSKSYNDPDLNKARASRTTLGRWGQPDDLAGLVIYLASDSSSYMTGQDIYIDGGWLIKGL